MQSWYLLVLGILATWRLTHLLNAEDGPWRIIAKIRDFSPGSVLHDLLSCFLCLSLWMALPFAYVLGGTWEQRLVLLPALSAAAILLERVTQRPNSQSEET